MNALSIKHCTKRYKTFTLSNLTFDLPQGMIIGLIGENGAGKSTLIKCILGIIEFDEGTITPSPLDFEKVSFIPDHCPYPDILTIEQLEKDLKEIYSSWDHDSFAKMCRQFQLPTSQKIREFSKGMKVKLCFCAALSHHANFLILDEATSGLDPVVRDKILDLLLQFIQEEDHTVLFSTHITGDLEKVADHILYLHKGKQMFLQSKDDLLNDYVMMHVSQDDFATIDPKKIIRYMRLPYSVNVFIKKEDAAFTYDPLRLEDVMLMYTKGEQL